uniref:Uncharacterized protein n=1 Tax=Anguilla anguilla TaxID=7936 RepID=A0A0E9XIY6_ANGAN
MTILFTSPLLENSSYTCSSVV